MALILAAAAPIEGGERGWATKNYSEASGPFRPEAAYCAAAAGLPVPNTMTFPPIGVRSTMSSFVRRMQPDETS